MVLTIAAEEAALEEWMGISCSAWQRQCSKIVSAPDFFNRIMDPGLHEPKSHTLVSIITFERISGRIH